MTYIVKVHSIVSRMDGQPICAYKGSDKEIAMSIVEGYIAAGKCVSLEEAK